MITVRKAADRGHARLDWLNSHHTFSFEDYHDPRHMGVANLRVINDDTVAPGGGFAMHGHRDMEIISCVLQGTLEHKDSMGNGSVIEPYDAVRQAADPDEALMSFLQTTYAAAAEAGGWPRASLEREPLPPKG